MKAISILCFTLALGLAMPVADPLARGDDDAVLKEHGVEPTAAGIKEYLAGLKPDPPAQKKASDWIGQLGDARFAVREAATRSLLDLPFVPLKELQAAAQSTEAETAARAKRILEHPKTVAKLQAAAGKRATTAAVLHLIAEKRIAGVVQDLLTVAPDFDADLVDLAGDAAAKTADADDLPAIRRALDGDVLAVRIVAVRALGKAGGAAARDELQKFLTDESPRVRVATAHALVGLGDRGALAALVSLLEVDDMAVRARAVQILRAATGENFGFNPFAKVDAQRDAIRQWRTWLADRGKTAQLHLPLVLKPLSEDLAIGLIAHYTFDRDAGGRIEDSSGHQRHGKSENAVAYVARGDTRAIQFTGRGEMGADGGYATLPWIDFAKLERFTVALSVRETGMTHEHGEAYITYGFDRGVGTEGSLGVAHLNSSIIFRVGDGQIWTDFLATDRNRWVHYAMTFDNGELRAYKDGKVVGQKRTQVQTVGDQAALARHWWSSGAGTSTRFQGAIDDVRVYDRALSKEQLRLLVHETQQAE